MTTLQTNRQYVLPGTVIGEDIQPGGVSVAPETRVPTYIGKGSPYIQQRNTGVTRGFIDNFELEFSVSSPYTATLPVLATGATDSAVLVDSTGIEVVKDQWRFSDDLTSIVVADAAYNPAASYSVSYQGNDTSVPDTIPTSDLRVLTAVGSQLDQNQYRRNVDFFIDTVTEAPAPALDADGAVLQHTNDSTSFSGLSHVGTGLGDVTLDEYAQYLHGYNRVYSLAVEAIAGSVVTFSWTASPVSGGNFAAPRVPVAAGVAAPTITVDSANPQTLSAVLEYGIRVNFDFTPGAFVIGDVYSFSAFGPSALEVDSAVANSNQFPEASTTLSSLDNVGTGSLTVDAESFSGTSNLSFKAQVTAVDNGSVSATLPTAKLVFSAAPADGSGIVFDNGRTGTAKIVKTFEFDLDSVQKIPGSTLVTLPVLAAQAATGSVTLGGLAVSTPVDGSGVILTDGVRSAAFEFDNDGVLSNPSAIKVLVGVNSATAAANLVTAINASALRITAVDGTSGNGGVGLITLTAQVAGTIGNSTIAVSENFEGVATDMSGGADVSVNILGAISNFIAAVNAADLGIVAVSDESNAYVVHMRHGAKLRLLVQPTLAATFSVNLGGVATVFEYTSGGAPGVGNTGIVIGANVAATIVATAAAVAALDDAVVASYTDGVLIAPLEGRNVSITSALPVTPSVVDDSASVNNGNSDLRGTGGLAGVALYGFSGGTDSSVSPDRVTLAWGCSGDLFARGTLSLHDGATAELFQGAKVSLSGAAAAPAQGVITLTAQPADTNRVTIADGILLTPVTFEFDSTSTVTPGNTSVAIGANLAASVANLAAAIAASALAYNVSVVGSSVILVHKKNGPGPANAYNTAITRVGSAINVNGVAGGRSNYAVGDVYTFTVKAARRFSMALDNRTTVLTVARVGLPEDSTAVVFNYESSTPEGGFGSVTASESNGGYLRLPGQISLVARNLSAFVVGDKFSVNHVNNNRLFWNLNAKATQSFGVGDVLVDRNGTVTGKFGSFYIALAAAPLPGALKMTLGGSAFTGFRQVNNGTIVVLTIADAAALAETLTVSYTHAGSEPAIGSSYYISGRYKRPDAAYNTPTLFYDLPSALEFLAPVTADNDLAIAVTIAFEQAQRPLAVAVIQVQDSDEDGMFSPDDIAKALDGAKEVSYMTDVVPLRSFQFLSQFLGFNVSSADPFEKREHMMYFGAPIGTPIGDEKTPGSLVFLSKRTLQVYGRSYAHGTRVLVAPRIATKTMTLSDGTVTKVTLDGSFVAGAVAACVAGMPTYSQTLLRSQLLGFDTVEVFGNSANLRLGAANTIFFSDAGNGVYTFEEDQTVDTYLPEYHEILPMRTKQDVTRIVRREMDANVIGMVPNTKGDAQATVAARLMQVLINLINRGIIAPYQDKDGNPRQINSSDIKVYADKLDPTLYHFYYEFYTRFAIKRLFGLYAVNKAVQG